MPDELLIVRDVEAAYTQKQILFGVDLSVRSGEVVALLGANGSGKSTVLNTVSGFVCPMAGSIKLGGEELAGKQPHQTFRRGVIQVSQARDLFPDMSAEENLKLGAVVRRGPIAELLAGVYESFPRLADLRHRPVHLLSGGEQQMVALGRALMGRPKILLLDEPSGGLAPRLVTEIATIMLNLKKQGVTMLMVEQNIKLALSVADRFLVLRDGRVTERGDMAGGNVREEEIVRSIYL